MIFDVIIQKRKSKFLKNRDIVFYKLHEIPDFYIELKWDLDTTILPFVGKLMP